MYFQKFFNMNHNKGPDHGDSMVNVEEALKYWNFREAKEAVRTMVAAYGDPSSMSICDAAWDYVSGLKVCIKDESLPHGDHKDFLYGCKQIALPPDLHTPLALASESIMVDAQKGLVKARCNSLAVVAIMLGFVEDVASGNAQATPEELDRRIESAETPNWFEDKMGEILGESINETRAQLPAVQPAMVKELQKVGKESGLFTIKTKKLKDSGLLDTWLETKDMRSAVELNDPKNPWKKKISDIKSKFKYDATKR